jgi:hypothetical protein
MTWWTASAWARALGVSGAAALGMFLLCALVAQASHQDRRRNFVETSIAQRTADRIGGEDDALAAPLCRRPGGAAMKEAEARIRGAAAAARADVEQIALVPDVSPPGSDVFVARARIAVRGDEPALIAFVGGVAASRIALFLERADLRRVERGFQGEFRGRLICLVKG